MSYLIMYWNFSILKIIKKYIADNMNNVLKMNIQVLMAST